MSTDYITGTNHSATLEAALKDFHEALTRRWREKVCEAAVAGNHDYPVAIRREASAQTQQDMWPYWSLPARHHLGLHGDCAYVKWVEGGQNGPLSGVQCDGDTGVREDTEELYDPATNQMVTIPPKIECGMGSLLSLVEDWAWGERDAVFYSLPLFDRHDLGALHSAHDIFVEIGTELGLEKAEGSSDDVGGSFPAMDERDIPGKVSTVAGLDATGQDWWAGWTGLAAERAKAGFFASVAPTLNNQSGILGCLANLYSDRAAIIEKGRNDALYWIQWATESLGETEQVTTDRTNGWKLVQGIGTAVSISGGWSGVGGAVGASIILVGFVGENIDSGGTSEEYANGIETVVTRLNDEIDTLNDALEDLERDYRSGVDDLRGTIHNIHSFNLELYDFTQNAPEGTGRGQGGYNANVDDILRLAEQCYTLGEEYERLLPRIAGTGDADPHLADKDGSPTEADKALLEVRDQLERFLRTTCGRYLVAGDQVRDAAEAYAQTEEDQRGAFDRTIEDWDARGVGEYDMSFSPDKYAQETERSDYDPYDGHPALGGSDPGAGDGEDYVLDEEREQ